MDAAEDENEREREATAQKGNPEGEDSKLLGIRGWVRVGQSRKSKREKEKKEKRKKRTTGEQRASRGNTNDIKKKKREADWGERDKRVEKEVNKGGMRSSVASRLFSLSLSLTLLAFSISLSLSLAFLCLSY